MRSNGVTLLSAVIIPPPEYTSQPVFEDAVGPSHTPADCAMRPNEGPGYQQRTFAMYVHHFNKCGVRVQQGSDGKEWISVTIRFPFMEGLRMAEDEYVMIMCKPQDRIATTQHVMDMRGTATEGRSVQPKKVFRSGPRDVACRMSLMTRGQGSRSFSREMKSGATVRVGQDLQIKAIVKEGDGWNAAMLKDVVISRISGNRISSNARTSQYPANNHDNINTVDVGENAIYRDQRTDDTTAHDVAQLVFGDGCRNPQYRPIAPFHPQRDTNNPLSVNFVFKAFMFQNMLDGESLRLSAQVVACAELSDCQQAFCNGEIPRGKRKRRELRNISGTVFEHPSVKNFTEDFQLTVTLGGFAQKKQVGRIDVSAATSVGGDMVVARCWQQWITEGRVYRRGGSGRPRNTNDREDRTIRRVATSAPTTSLASIQRHLPPSRHPVPSRETIRRRLTEVGLRSRRPLRRLPLTPHHRQCRLDFCRPRATWSVTDWRRVVFSDESRFSLSADDHRTRVWRRSGQRSDPAFIVERHTAISQGVTVWGAISWDTRSSLVVLQGTLTARRYVDDILTPIVLPMLSSRPGAIYQQDNARPHTARLSQQCLQGYDVLPWPARSPDLSPIEHVCDALGRQLQPSRDTGELTAQMQKTMAGSSTGGHK
ncbi:transposable element Tcb2 transposase [Trichonephila clavipes]|nr:transposable element Tcb2 transposase [Trichonephila clavipes]